MSNVTVFGASDCIEYSKEYLGAKKLGKFCGEKGYNLVTGGYGGVMEAVFIGALEFDIKRIAVITDFFKNRKANPFANEIVKTDTYINRMVKLIELGDLFVIFPGGPGTLTELSAVWTLRDRDAFDKPIIIIGEMWRELIELMNYYSKKSLEASKNLVFVEDDIKAAELVEFYFQRS